MSSTMTAILFPGRIRSFSGGVPTGWSRAVWINDAALDDDAIVIGVNFEPGVTEEKLKKFVELYLVSYPITLISDEIIDALGEPRGLPTSILISPEGEVAKKVTGMVSDRSLNKFISQYELQKNE